MSWRNIMALDIWMKISFSEYIKFLLRSWLLVFISTFWFWGTLSPVVCLNNVLPCWYTSDVKSWSELSLWERIQCSVASCLVTLLFFQLKIQLHLWKWNVSYTWSPSRRWITTSQLQKLTYSLLYRFFTPSDWVDILMLGVWQLWGLSGRMFGLCVSYNNVRYKY